MAQERYSRQLILPGFGPVAQTRLNKATVVMIGAGGLGSPALRYLAAAGVGTLIIVDGDCVSESNLHRQILFSEGDVGQSKARLAAKRLQASYPIRANAVEDYLRTDNAEAVLSSAELVIDGSDNFATRYLVNDACVLLGKPLVWGSVYQYEGQVSVFNAPPFQVSQAPQSPNLRCLFPEPPPAASMPSCAEAGVLGTVVGTVGSLMATEAIKLLTGIGKPLAGLLWHYDAIGGITQQFGLAPDTSNPLFSGEILGLDPERYTPATCPPGVHEISPDELPELLATPRLQMVDVRQPWEHAIDNLGGQLIPLDELPARWIELSPTSPVLLYCARGQRSLAAASHLASKGFTSVYSLRGGIEAYRHLQSASAT